MNTKRLIYMMALAVCLWGCGPESNHPLYEDFSNGIPEAPALSVAHPAPYPICSDKIVYPIVDGQGGTAVSYCGGVPCSGNQSDWGSATIFNDTGSIYIDVFLAQEWFVDKVEVYAGDGSQITWNQGLPAPDSDWQVGVLDHALNCYHIKVPVGAIGGQCPDLSVRLRCHKADFFAGADPQSVCYLYVGEIVRDNNGVPTGAINYDFPWCFESCAPQVNQFTAGECTKCEAEVNASFYTCDSVAVSSCKQLSNVVLAFTDGNFQKFDGLTAPSGVFQGEGKHAGKEISHIYVKSGCYESNEGPDFGYRIDGPC